MKNKTKMCLVQDREKCSLRDDLKYLWDPDYYVYCSDESEPS